MAPEIHPYLRTNTPTASSEEYTNAVDLWAVGCITYRLITGQIPFPDASLSNYVRDKRLFPYSSLLGNNIERPCIEFIEGLLNISPRERLSAPQALKHPWIVLGRRREYFCFVALLLKLLKFT
jgi:serine/threonine protein kinase